MGKAHTDDSDKQFQMECDNWQIQFQTYGRGSKSLVMIERYVRRVWCWWPWTPTFTKLDTTDQPDAGSGEA